MVKNLGQCKSTVHILNLQKKTKPFSLSHTQNHLWGQLFSMHPAESESNYIKKKLDKEPPACQMCVGRFKMHNKGAERLLLIK